MIVIWDHGQFAPPSFEQVCRKTESSRDAEAKITGKKGHVRLACEKKKTLPQSGWFSYRPWTTIVGLRRTQVLIVFTFRHQLLKRRILSHKKSKDGHNDHRVSVLFLKQINRKTNTDW